MAQYTEEQKSTIEYLINRGKSVHKQLENSKSNEDKEKLQNELNGIKMELNDALNAEAMFRAHLKMAKEHLNDAEAIYQKWRRGIV
jgi:hypothetical protein